MSSSTERWVDVALALLLFAITVAYLTGLPRNLGPPDEAHALHEAKRVLAGEAMYRDIFELILPGWIYLMAALFHVFGTTLGTARITAAVIHAAIAVLVFLICRRLSVRQTLAWACAFAYLVVGPPMFPVASQHWLATLGCVALLAMCLRPLRGHLWSLVTGVLVGLLIAVHQQRGISMGIGIAAFLVVEALLRRRYGDPCATTSLVRQLMLLTGGTFVVVVPLIVGLVASAGFEPVWRALVIQPLVQYPESVPWGHAMWGSGDVPSAFPRLLIYFPVVMVLSVSTLFILGFRRRYLERARTLALLTVFAGASMASIAYFPDIIHIAFIAPIFFVAVAEVTEWALCLLPNRLGRALGYGLSVIVVLAGGVQLEQNLVRLRQQYPLRYVSEFGEIAVAGLFYPKMLDQLRDLLRGAPSRTLYCHPMSRYTYLLVDAHNPTRFSFVIPPVYTAPDQVQEVIATLAAKRVPYILAEGKRDDAIMRFIWQHYELRPGPKPLADAIWHRKE